MDLNTRLNPLGVARAAMESDALDPRRVASEARAQEIQRIQHAEFQALEAELARLVAAHGHALLFDGHSIRGELPWLFEGELPALNIGTADGKAAGYEYDIDLHFRGVIPMMMRGESVPRSKRIHTLRDVQCEADRLGMVRPVGTRVETITQGAPADLAASSTRDWP